MSGSCCHTSQLVPLRPALVPRIRHWKKTANGAWRRRPALLGWYLLAYGLAGCQLREEVPDAVVGIDGNEVLYCRTRRVIHCLSTIYTL